MCRTHHTINYLGCGHSIKITEAISETTPHVCNADGADWLCPKLKYLRHGLDEPHKCPACLEAWAAGMDEAYAVLKKKWKAQLSATNWEEAKQTIRKLASNALKNGVGKGNHYKKAEGALHENGQFIRRLKGRAKSEKERAQRNSIIGPPADAHAGKHGTVPSAGTDSPGPSDLYWAGDMTDKEYSHHMDSLHGSPSLSRETDKKRSVIMYTGGR